MILLHGGEKKKALYFIEKDTKGYSVNLMQTMDLSEFPTAHNPVLICLVLWLIEIHFQVRKTKPK